MIELMSKISLKTLKIQHQKNKQSNLKMGKEPE